MAVRGRKPRAVALRVIEGTKSHSPTLPKDPVVAEGRPVPAPYVKGRALALWHFYLPTLPWLATPDGPKFSTWCRGEADNETNGELWSTARHSEHRKLGSELGMDTGARARLSSGAKDKPDEGEDFFSNRA